MQAADFSAQHDANELCVFLSWFYEPYEHAVPDWMFM